jgi:hypothetical protein
MPNIMPNIMKEGWNIKIIIGILFPDVIPRPLSTSKEISMKVNQWNESNIPDLTGKTATAGGEFFGPSGLMEIRGFPKRTTSNPLSHDVAIGERLWNVSAQLTGVTFGI